jgi:hypothetical protein
MKHGIAEIGSNKALALLIAGLLIKNGGEAYFTVYSPYFSAKGVP